MKNIENKKIFFKKVLSLSLSCLLVLPIFYMFAFEATVLDAATATDNVVVSLTVDPGITITTPADVTMSPNIGISANGSIGSAIWNVKTNNVTGYKLALKASASPALVSGSNNFADYTETTTGTPEVWSVASGAKEFGYSAYGTDVVTATWGTGASCGTGGVPAGTMKYVGFKTTDKDVASKSAVTTTSGENTTVCFAAEQDNTYAASGTYTATITATATTN